MTYFRITFRKLAGLSLWLFVMLASSTAFAQSGPASPPNDEGLSSYIFSPRAVTVILVLILIVQLVYRHRVRHAKTATVQDTHSPIAPPQSNEPMKKRYDRGEISKLLKASATSKNHGRSLEEAIRMSQEAQDNMMESMHGHHALEENVALAGEPESHAVEARPQSVGTESSQETKASK